METHAAQYCPYESSRGAHTLYRRRFVEIIMLKETIEKLEQLRDRISQTKVYL